MGNRLLIIIPAYNEEASIVSTVENLISVCPQYDYVIINDGSNDRTLSLCKKHNYNVIDQPINLGLSGTFQTGVKYALRNGYDAVLQFDADGQHLPEYIEPLLNKLNEGYDIVIGSRFVDKKKPKSFRMLGSNIISFDTYILTGQKISDPTSGMRIFGKRVLPILAYNPNISPEPDSIAYMMINGAKVAEVQVEMKERMAGKSYLTFEKSVMYMLTICTSDMIFSRFRPKVYLEDSDDK